MRKIKKRKKLFCILNSHVYGGLLIKDVEHRQESRVCEVDLDNCKAVLTFFLVP